MCPYFSAVEVNSPATAGLLGPPSYRAAAAGEKPSKFVSDNFKLRQMCAKNWLFLKSALSNEYTSKTARFVPTKPWTILRRYFPSLVRKPQWLSKPLARRGSQQRRTECAAGRSSRTGWRAVRERERSPSGLDAKRSAPSPVAPGQTKHYSEGWQRRIRVAKSRRKSSRHWLTVLAPVWEPSAN